ncbi:hypothetical protein [Sphingomonas xinjiangensis]|uniref:Uncharacterized protein n=1 Tax=Sphingomonas xinjiangensis TaxID=643568 RepID=A0A840YS44_9SPHN|nr:hypothetical protein [Sphingomonas xinjiangensis]MBB5712495.1 hypothetical protein [Sphingomonas xinjiangensis]
MKQRPNSAQRRPIAVVQDAAMVATGAGAGAVTFNQLLLLTQDSLISAAVVLILAALLVSLLLPRR